MLDIDPKNRDANHLMGMALHAERKSETALGHLMVAREASPESAMVLNNLAKVQMALGRHDDAIDSFRLALTAAPDDSDILTNFANLLSELGRYDEAIPLYRHALDENRRNGAVLYYLGVALLFTHRPTEAVPVLEQATALAPNHAEALFKLANAYAEIGELDKSIEHYTRVLRHAPNSANVLVNLGNALFERGRLKTAAHTFQRAISIEPKDPFTYIDLGNVEESLGRISSAEQSFRGAIVHDPANGPAHQALARIKKFKPGDPDLLALERLHADPKLRGDNRTSICFALAKAYDDVGDADRAFQVLSEANKRVRDGMSYDIEEHRQLYAAIAGAFDADTIERLSGVGDPSSRPIFVLGMPRSGTTLVEQILSAHPHVHGAGELTVLPRLVQRIGDETGRMFPEFVRAQPPEAFAAWGRRYVDELAATTPASLFAVDKLPANHRLIGFIHAILPNAVIVHCRRHPVATCFSCFQQQFTGQQRFSYDLEELGHFYRLYDDLMAHWHRVLPGKIIDVRYEDLIADQEGQSRRLLEWIGLEWNAGVLAFDKLDRPVTTASSAQVRRPLYNDAKERWRLYERHLGPLLTSLGTLPDRYELQTMLNPDAATRPIPVP